METILMFIMVVIGCVTLGFTLVLWTMAKRGIGMIKLIFTGVGVLLGFKKRK